LVAFLVCEIGTQKEASRTQKHMPSQSYYHNESKTPMRPEVGTQSRFKKKKGPKTYRYESSLSPELEWDGKNFAREEGEALLRQEFEANSLEGELGKPGRRLDF
jgi:adenine-specific DNA-methyltransferase